jgi:hypothetical protein
MGAVGIAMAVVRVGRRSFVRHFHLGEDFFAITRMVTAGSAALAGALAKLDWRILTALV